MGSYKADACGVFNPARQVPGWQETALAEAEARNDAMIGLADTICGLPVKPLTWRHIQWLEIYQSPFLAQASPEQLSGLPDIHLHVARFMWVLSPQWRPYSRWRRALFFRRYRRRLYGRKTKVDEIVRTIHKFMSDSLWDLTSIARRGGRNYFSSCASMVHLLCSKYGSLSPDPDAPNAAIDLPLNIAGQLVRAVISAELPPREASVLLCNRTEQLERDWLAKKNEELKRN